MMEKMKMTSVGRKMFMGASGLLLASFLVFHFLGNVVMFWGPSAYNQYVYYLRTNPLFPLGEWGLIIMFSAHILMAAYLTVKNRMARPEAYAMKRYTRREGGGTLASSTMPYTGLLVLLFLFLHITYIRNGYHYDVVVDGIVMKDIYRTLLEYFASPWNVLGYVAAMGILGVHLSHGFQSAFQSLSLRSPDYAKTVKRIGYGFVGFVTFGFSIFPIYCFIIGRGQGGF